VKVLAELGQDSCELLLRLKVLQGDKELDVLADCFHGLMTMAPDHSLPFVGRFVASEDPLLAEEAALAVGNSRRPQALVILRASRDGSADPVFKRMLLLPIALTRCEEAFKLLLDVVKDEHPQSAAAAVKALAVYSDSPQRREAIRTAVAARHDPAFTAAYATASAGTEA
jgi:hypothetical protein